MCSVSSQNLSVSLAHICTNHLQAGKEGTIVTSSKVRDRLIKETDNNVTRE